MKKHIQSSQTEQKCNMCRKEFKTSIELVNHKAKDHYKEEELLNVEFHSTPKSDKEIKSSEVKD